MKNETIHFETTGCRLNQIETESAARLFTDKSYSVSLTPLTAQSPVDSSCVLCVVNTCAVTQKAEQKDRRVIRLCLEKLPNAVVVVTGCYAQLSKDKINEMSERVACLPGLLKNRIKNVLEELEKREENVLPSQFALFLREEIFAPLPKKNNTSEDAFSLSTDSFLSHSRGSIKIQDGCNCACSYCTIHIARGASVSLDAQTVIDRIKQMESAKVAEVVFTAVNIAQYKGRYGEDYVDFPHLLKLCLKNTEKIAFRISSLYPECVDEYFLEVIKDKRVRPHFHISVQNGSDKILSSMGRKYTSADLIKVCENLRKSKKNPFIACDIITGFPGETDEDFSKTYEMCQKINFSWIHVFPFSPRPGTPAYSMKNQVPQGISGHRAKKLTLLAASCKNEYIKSCVGQVFSAVLENVKKSVYYKVEKCESAAASENPVVFHAVTENFLHCEILMHNNSAGLKQGSAVTVKILSTLESELEKGGGVECLAELIY